MCRYSVFLEEFIIADLRAIQAYIARDLAVYAGRMVDRIK
jgi:hypothetical protein